jgi:hypothetical protein
MLKLQGLCQKKSKQIIFYFDTNLILMYAYFVIRIIKQMDELKANFYQNKIIKI